MPASPETYVIAEGGILSAGRFRIPSWVPAVGTIADVSLNTMSAVKGSDPDPSHQYNYWAGCAYARDYGDKGTLIFNTGGHSATLTNYVYGYDVATRLHFMERQSPQHYASSVDGYVADKTTGWLWGDTAESSLQVGETFGYHSYAFMTWLPPSEGAPNGWLYTPGRGAMSAGGQKSTLQAHKLPLGLGLTTPYQTHGDPLTRTANYFFTLRDSLRNRVVWFGNDGTYNPARKLYYQSVSDGSKGEITWLSANGEAIFPYYCIGKHAEADDLYLITRLTGSTHRLWVFDPTTSTLYTPTKLGTQPSPPYDCTVEWVEAWRAFVYFHPGSSTVWILSAPENPRTGTWTWSTQTLTGTIRQPSQTVAAYNRLTYVPEYELFLWPASYTTPMQGFRLARPS